MRSVAEGEVANTETLLRFVERAVGLDCLHAVISESVPDDRDLAELFLRLVDSTPNSSSTSSETSRKMTGLSSSAVRSKIVRKGPSDDLGRRDLGGHDTSRP